MSTIRSVLVAVSTLAYLASINLSAVGQDRAPSGGGQLQIPHSFRATQTAAHRMANGQDQAETNWATNQEPAHEPKIETEEAQEEEEIETDRDSFTPATSTVRCGRFVLESAYSFIDNRTVPETHSFPELLVRYGASDILELRIGWNYEVGGIGSPISGNVSQDFNPDPELEESARLLYGAKVFLTEQCRWTPQSSLMIQGFSPTAGEINDTQMSATHVFGWKLANDLVFDSGLRYATSSAEEDHFNVWSPSTVIKVPIGERWKAHVEYFGVMSEGREVETTQHFISPGAHYLITRDFEIGIRVGWGLNDQSPNFFSNAGIGWLF